jgi:hypothetical protein
LGLASGVKLALWGAFVSLSLVLLMLGWAYFVGADAVTFCSFLIILFAGAFSVLVILKIAKRAKPNQ